MHESRLDKSVGGRRPRYLRDIRMYKQSIPSFNGHVEHWLGGCSEVPMSKSTARITSPFMVADNNSNSWSRLGRLAIFADGQEMFVNDPRESSLQVWLHFDRI